MKLRKIHIENYKLFQNFDIDLTHNGKSQNFIVIAGINGSGKTTLLKEIICHSLINKSIYQNSSVEIEYKDNHNDKDNDHVFMMDSQSLQPNSLEQKKFLDNVLFPSLNNIFYYKAGLQLDKQPVKDVIIKYIDTLIYEKDKKSSEAYIMAQEVLNAIFNGFDLQIQFKGIDRNKEILFKNSKSDNIKIEELSNGEQELFTKALSIYLAEIKDSIILIDEPESSLHPTWQNRITQLYQHIADKYNNQIILSTHSPHIVSAVHKEQIRVLIKENNHLSVISNFNRSYGAKVDQILLEIFRTNGLRIPEIENKLLQLREMTFSNQYNTHEFNTLKEELENTIGFDDNDLALIRLEIAKRKKNEKNQ
ncbi:ATP-binding protein [Candidatus Magnetomorum sp. HK-1]|nr:ATP-binding protein [Candidatus Magnetomorum sp. HK-1]